MYHYFVLFSSKCMYVVLSQNSFTMLCIFLDLENHHITTNIQSYPFYMLIVSDICSVYLSHVFVLFFSGPLRVFFFVLYMLYIYIYIYIYILYIRFIIFFLCFSFTLSLSLAIKLWQIKQSSPHFRAPIMC